MDVMADSTFNPLIIRRGLAGPARITADTRRWTLRQTARAALPHGAAVTSLTFSPLAPHDIAAASGPTVAIVDPHSGGVRRTLARFRDVARSPDFKPDGRLLVAGCDNGTVQLFDLASRSVLRVFNRHDGAVHSSLFTSDGLRVMTGCDDGIVRGWDLATAKQLFTLRGSADYVRSQASSPASRHIWAAGSYDGRARIYDLRTRKPVFTIAHGAQVDKIILLPGGARAVTIGGPSVKVWDFFSGGKCVGEMECHAKAVTCGAIAEGGKKLLTGGLDGMVKVHDMGSLELVSTIPCRGQVLSLAVGPDDGHVAAGLVDGTVDVRGKVSGRAVAVVKMPDGGYGDEPTFVPQETGALKERLFEGWGRGFEKTKAKKKTANPGSMRYFMRGQNSKLTDARDVVVKKRRRTGLKEHDVMLRKFAYGRALDSVLVEGKWKPRTTRLAVGLIEELIARDGLRTALAGRSAEGLVPILRLINSKVDDPEFSVLLCHLANVVLDLYGGVFGQGERRDAVDALLFKVQQKVKREIAVIRQLCSLQGMLEMIPSS